MNIHETLQQAVENNDTNTLITIASEQAASAERATAEVESLRLRLDHLRNEFASFRGTAQRYLNDLLDSDDTDTLAGLEGMQLLAEWLGVDLQDTFAVTVTLKYDVTVTAPRGTDIENVKNALTWSGYPRFSTFDSNIEVTETDENWEDSIEVERR